MKGISKILIANRGEIARRIALTCKEMNIEVVGIYADDDANLPYLDVCDYTFNLGNGPLSETYINIEKIIQIAKESNSCAIHPGFGLLSENPKFVNAATKAGIIFIGPSTDVMDLMGDKKTSKVKMDELGIPLLPGYHGDEQDAKFLEKKANEIGFPLLIKASAGGGGKGMRIVKKTSEFQAALTSCQSEGEKSFGSSQVLLERYIESPRHIEVQVLSDEHGNHFHFYERECSMQRRHQKVIEETPSVAFDEKLRSEICACAVKISSGVDYVGAGTVEFILDENKKFYFLEMNTRLQVEHPITEMCTGFDLVRLQINVANGEKLPFSQKDIVHRGHAIEGRLYFEDPANSFLPAIGKINQLKWPVAPGLRIDFGLREGNEVTINYDPMGAKIITWANNRSECIEKMDQALAQTKLIGPTSNLSFLRKVLTHKTFVSGDYNTHTLVDSIDDFTKVDDELKIQAIAFSLIDKTASTTNNKQKHADPWSDITL